MDVPYVNTRDLPLTPITVDVLRVESPSLIWVKLVRDHFDYLAMGRELQWRMNHDRRSLSSDLHTPVAVKVWGRWQRGKVIVRDDHRCRVFLRDRGVEVERRTTKVFLLPDTCRTEPWNAIPCTLANTSPLGGAAQWSSQTALLTKHLCEDQHVTMELQMATSDGRGAYVDLFLDHPNDERVNLRELLVGRGHANHWPYIKPPVVPDAESH